MSPILRQRYVTSVTTCGFIRCGPPSLRAKPALRLACVSSIRTNSAGPAPIRLWRLSKSVTIALIALSSALAIWSLQRREPRRTFDSHAYSKAVVTSHTRPTPLTYLIRLRLTDPPSTPPPFYAVYIKSPDVQIERPYTPLRGLEDGDEVELWIKRERGGELSRYLSGRNVGEEVEVRGWVPGIAWVDKRWDDVVMISGGTGITPFLQLLHHLFLSPSAQGTLGTTRFTLLHASPSPSDLPPESILSSLIQLQKSRPDVFSLHVFVDSSLGEAHQIESAGETVPLAVRRITSKDLLQWSAPSPAASSGNFLEQLFGRKTTDIAQTVPKNVLFLVCGPEPMVEAFAGPRARDLTEGPIAGILGGMGYGPDQVRKL